MIVTPKKVLGGAQSGIDLRIDRSKPALCLSTGPARSPVLDREICLPTIGGRFEVYHVIRRNSSAYLAKHDSEQTPRPHRVVVHGVKSVDIRVAFIRSCHACLP